MATVEDLIRYIGFQRRVRSTDEVTVDHSDSREFYATITYAIRSGTLPHLGAIDALRRAAGLTLGSVYLTLGVNLDRLAWLRSPKRRPNASRAKQGLLAGYSCSFSSAICGPQRTLPHDALVQDCFELVQTADQQPCRLATPALSLRAGGSARRHELSGNSTGRLPTDRSQSDCCRGPL
jgi:hypothetical protein